MKLIFIMLLLPTICSAQVIKGNVFYKYNNYVGNRGDAGSDVFLISNKEKDRLQKTQTDISGNFSFESLDTGQYLLIVKSKNVKQKPARIAIEYKYSPIKKYFGCNITAGLVDSLTLYSRQYDSLSSNFPKKKKLLKDHGVSIDFARNNMFGVLSRMNESLSNCTPYKQLKYLPFEMSGLGSISIKEITIDSPQKKENVIVDFGITFF